MLKSPPKKVGAATYSITWMNSVQDSRDTITVDKWYISGGPFTHSTIVPTDAGTVISPHGFEQLGWFNNSFGGEPVTNGYLVLKTPYGFVGINIHAPARVFSIGNPPYYEVFMSSTGDDELVWRNPVPNPSVKYTFPSEKVGYNITITPSASETTLFLTVNIKQA
jgi:hypothetical protein